MIVLGAAFSFKRSDWYVLDGLLCHLYGHPFTEVSGDIAEGVLGERHRFVAEPVFRKVSIRQFLYGSDAFVALVRKSVEPFFKLPSPLLLRIACQCLQ